jgi:hypothetical protein
MLRKRTVVRFLFSPADRKVSWTDKVIIDDGFCYPLIPALVHCTDPYLFIRYLPRCTGQTISSSQVSGLRPLYGCECIEGSSKFKTSPPWGRRTFKIQCYCRVKIRGHEKKRFVTENLCNKTRYHRSSNFMSAMDTGNVHAQCNFKTIHMSE